MPSTPPRPRRGTTPRPDNIYDLEFDQYAATIGTDRAHAVYRELYRSAPSGGIGPATRAAATQLGLTTDTVTIRHSEPGSMTVKHLVSLDAATAVETVAITRRTGVTACVSSQVGCAFRCAFCASGQDGLLRNLTPGEIVQQVLVLGREINRIVFMGIGEPLHNDANVLAAIRILRDRRGRGMRTRGMTISTIGPPDALRRLREQHLAINLTLSLHATTDEVRHKLIPGARSTSVTDVVQAARSWARRHSRRVTYVYLVLPGVNDSGEDLRRLASWTASPLARVNLMRWNPVDGDVRFKRADDRTLSRFRRGLLAAGVDVTVRDTQGLDTQSACGQLRARHGRRGRA